MATPEGKEIRMNMVTLKHCTRKIRFKLHKTYIAIGPCDNHSDIISRSKMVDIWFLFPVV
jgi:hypothetical protein